MGSNSKNELGQVTKSENKNGLYETSKLYTPLGFPQARSTINTISSNPVAVETYNFNANTGNLMTRTNTVTGWQETFSYDNFDRLTDVGYYNILTSWSRPILHMEFNNEGNILKKTDVSLSSHNWKYNGYGLQRVPEADTATAIPVDTQDVAYHPFKMVETISEDSAGLRIEYNADWERIKAEYSQGGALIKTKYYTKNFEKIVDSSGNETNIMYIWGGEELAAIVVKDNSGVQVYYALTDYLGSITHILDNQGTTNDGVVEVRSFDAWGRMRDPYILQYYTSPPAMLCDRGYTGHEHLNEFGIINMNGRLYDPVVGRMFSPDPYVADNTNSQAYNRYSYAMNNPLKYTDPDGNFVITAGMVAIALTSAYLGGIAADYRGGNFMAAFSISLISGLAGGVIGSVVGNAISLGNACAAGAISGTISGAAGGFSGRFFTSLYEGNNFGTAALHGLKGATVGAVFGGITGGLMGGLKNVENHKYFWTGETKPVSYMVAKYGYNPMPYSPLARVAGINYDLNSFDQFARRHANVYATHYGGVEFKGCSEFTLDGVPWKPRAEVMGNTVVTSYNTVTVGFRFQTSHDMLWTDYRLLAAEPGSNGFIHTHSGPGTVRWKDPTAISGYKGVTLHSGPSGTSTFGDRSLAGSSRYLHVVVDKQYIWLYNANTTYRFYRPLK
jgi:RHS repeat-associated protein